MSQTATSLTLSCMLQLQGPGDLILSFCDNILRILNPKLPRECAK